MFSAIVIDKTDDKQGVSLTQVDEAQLPEGDVTIDVEYSTLNYKDGTKKIDVTPEAVIVRYVNGSKDELKAGAKIYIPAATRQADGSLMTGRVNVGRGVTPL